MRISRRMGIYASGGGPLWLFDGDNGGDVTKVTGGWTITRDPSKYYTCDASVGANYIHLSHKRNDSNSNSVSVTTVNLIDFSKINTLYIGSYRNVTHDNARPNVYLLNESGNSVAVVTLSKSKDVAIASIDCSKITVPCRVKILVGGAKNVATQISNYVIQIWGE